MKREIVKFSVDTELDLVLANKRAIKLAETVGLTKSEQTRFATAMSEISRNCIEYAKDCSITLSVQKITVNFLLVAEINDKGNGIKDLEGIFSGKFVRKRTKGLGIKNARMLVDDFAIVSDNEGTMVSLGLRFKPSVTITDELLNQWSNMFNNELPISPYDEIKKRNLDLVILSEQLKKSEENYSILTDTVPDLIWSTDASGMLLFANKWFHEYTGKDIHTFMFEFLLHPDEVEFHLNQQLAYIQMGKPYQFECRLRKANSSKFIWHLFKSVPVKNENKEIEKWVNVCTDIEAQK
jgi:PAS domain S-box-containing protein